MYDEVLLTVLIFGISEGRWWVSSILIVPSTVSLCFEFEVTLYSLRMKEHHLRQHLRSTSSIIHLLQRYMSPSCLVSLFLFCVLTKKTQKLTQTARPFYCIFRPRVWGLRRIHMEADSPKHDSAFRKNLTFPSLLPTMLWLSCADQVRRWDRCAASCLLGSTACRLHGPLAGSKQVNFSVSTSTRRSHRSMA
jgi:hypothetical protein